MSSGDDADVIRLEMCGLLTSDAFQRAKACAKNLHAYLPERFPSPQVRGLFDVDWVEYLAHQRRENGGSWWALQRPVAVFVNDRFVGSDEDLFDLLPAHCVFYPPPERVSHSVADYLNPGRSYCYMDIDIGDERVGSFTFELFDDVVPNTCDNFRRLCSGDVSYKGSQIHRIAIPSFVQGGILQSGEVELFSDENYSASHDKRGILSMANDGVHTNGSQFFITLSPATWMNRKYVAFGRLTEGAQTLAAIEQVPTYYEMPTKRIEIAACGLKYTALGETASEVTPGEITSEMLVRSLLDEIIEKMGAAEVEVADERDAESELTMEKYKRGEYSAGITEDMLSDVEPLDEELPDSLKIVWLLLREMVSDKALVQAFATKLVNDIVDAVFKEMRIKDTFSELLAAFTEWPGQLDALMALVRKVLKDTKRLIDILDLGPAVFIVRELLDEMLDCAISTIESGEETAADMLEEIVDKTIVMSCVKQVLSEMISSVLEKTGDAELKGAEAFGKQPEETEKAPDEDAPKSPEEIVEQKPEDATKPAEEIVEQKPEDTTKPAEETVEQKPEDSTKPAEETVEQKPEDSKKTAEEIVEQKPEDTTKPAEETVEQKPEDSTKPIEETVEQKPEEADKPSEEKPVAAAGEGDADKEETKSAEVVSKPGETTGAAESEQATKPAEGFEEKPDTPENS